MNNQERFITADFAQEAALRFLQRIREFELEEARRLQTAIVPTEPLRVHPLELASRFRPVAEVGGDFLDYFQIPGGRVGFYLGDVVGKGLPAALYAALSVGTLRGFNKRTETPGSILTHLNQRLRMHNLPGRFCAAQYGLFDPGRREICFSNAGLPLPLHLSNSGCRTLGQGGLPSGMVEAATYEQHAIHLEAGESVVFYTDGIIEATNEKGEEFGVSRLAEVCAWRKHLTPVEQLDQIFEKVDRFAGGAPQHDDMTALILKLC